MPEGFRAPSLRRDASKGPFLAAYNCPFRQEGRPVHRASAVRIYLQEMTTQIHPTTRQTQRTKLHSPLPGACGGYLLEPIVISIV